jgi:hypothetical protein
MTAMKVTAIDISRFEFDLVWLEYFEKIYDFAFADRLLGEDRSLARVSRRSSDNSLGEQSERKHKHT